MSGSGWIIIGNVGESCFLWILEGRQGLYCMISTKHQNVEVKRYHHQNDDGCTSVYRKLCSKGHDNDIYARYCRKCREKFEQSHGFKTEVGAISFGSMKSKAIKISKEFQHKLFPVHYDLVLLEKNNGTYVSIDFGGHAEQMIRKPPAIVENETIDYVNGHCTFLKSGNRLVSISNAALVHSCIADGFEHYREKYTVSISDKIKATKIFQPPSNRVFAWNKDDKLLWNVNNVEQRYKTDLTIDKILVADRNVFVLSGKSFIQYDEKGNVAGSYAHSTAVIDCITVHGYIFFLDAKGRISRMDMEGGLSFVQPVDLPRNVSCRGLEPFSESNNKYIVVKTDHTLFLLDIFNLDYSKGIDSAGAVFQSVFTIGNHIISTRQNPPHNQFSVQVYHSDGTIISQYLHITPENSQEPVGITQIWTITSFLNNVFAIMEGKDGRRYLVKMEL